MEWPIFAAVILLNFALWKAPASLKQWSEVILRMELKQTYCEILEPVPAVLASCNFQGYLEILICHLVSIYYRVMTCFDGLYLKKCLQRFESKYRYFIWAKRNTAQRAVMVHSASSIALLLASFDVALPSEREKSSWIDWTIEVSPSTLSVLLGLFPARRSRFRVSLSHHAIYCTWRSAYKFCTKSLFYDSWQLAAQAEKWRWAGHCKFLLFKIFNFSKLEVLIQVLNEPT